MSQKFNKTAGIFFKRDFLSWGHDRVVKINYLRILSIARVWCCLGFYIDLPGDVIWQHIHPSTLHSYWEEGWQDSNCLNHTAVLQLSHREIFIFLKIPGKDLTGSLWIISSLQNKAQNVVLQQEIYHLCVTLHQTSWFVWATWVYYTRIAGSFSLY